MNTAVISALDEHNVVLHKTRQLDEHDAIWSAVVTAMAEDGVAKVKVQRYDASDTLVQQYLVTVLAA